jgi:hypothetical protein
VRRMSGAAAARQLVGSLAAPAGSVSASLWYDRSEPYIRVYLAPDVWYLESVIPSLYRGYDVVVEPMPKFTQLNRAQA